AQLLRDHPEIVSIAPRLKLDEKGRPTKDAVLVIGVKRINPIRFGPGAAVRAQPAHLPTRLPAITVDGRVDAKQFVEVIIEQEGDLVLESFAVKRRPCPGGYSVGHPLIGAGTLGGVLRRDGVWGYILSCNHVLAAQNA